MKTANEMRQGQSRPIRHVHFPSNWENEKKTIFPHDVNVWNQVDADSWAPFPCPCCAHSFHSKPIVRYDVYEFVNKKKGKMLVNYCVAGVLSSNPLAFMAAVPLNLAGTDHETMRLPVDSSFMRCGSDWEVWTKVIVLHRGVCLQVLAVLFLQA